MITVIDEASPIPGMNFDRVVQFAPDGSNSNVYGSNGTGEGEFRFFQQRDPVLD